jgi:hypothetical protein
MKLITSVYRQISALSLTIINAVRGLFSRNTLLKAARKEVSSMRPVADPVSSTENLEHLFDRYSEKKLAKFKAYHLENPHVYQEFLKLAFKMKETGRTKYSAETIINVMRWNMDLKTTGKPFKISNDYRSIYARLLVYNHPEFIGFFDMKGLKNEGLEGKE